MSAVDENSPIYLQLREVVRDRVDSGEYPPGCLIPSENALAKTYGVNRLTARSALDALVEEGILKRVQGKGAFVVGRRLVRDLDNLTGFRQSVTDSKAQAGIKILGKEVRKAKALYADRLGIDPDDDIYAIKRLNLADGKPVSLEYTYIPCKLVPNLMEIDLEVFSLYDVYGFNGEEAVRAWETLDIVPIEPRAARSLGVEANKDVLLLTCISYDRSGRVIEYMSSFNRSDMCHFTVKNGEHLV